MWYCYFIICSFSLVAQPALTSNQALLTQKISILALMELAFKRPSDQRTIPFQDVSVASKLPLDEVNYFISSHSYPFLYSYPSHSVSPLWTCNLFSNAQVEHLIMKALSLKLVRGTIDELDKTVTITWVQPRVLGNLLYWFYLFCIISHSQ